jgi:PAS domain S-box-containing protein
LKENGHARFETFHRAKDGRVYPVEIQSNFLEFEGKEYSCSFVTDISERKRTEEALLLTQHCVDNSFIGICILERDRIIKVNQQICRSLGYTPEELMSMSVFDIDPFITEEEFARLLKEFHEKGYNSFESRHRRKDGTTFPVEITTTRVRFGGRELGISFTQDTTSRKKAEERLCASLAEKTVLLKEIHHRVKNNLQIICFLLELQSDSIPDAQSRSCFQKSQDRIRSMALVHEQLYRSRDFASIDFTDYVENLATYLFNSYVREPGRISLRVEADSVLLDIDMSIPCGLIINELVSNSLKHAFADGREGEIAIGLSTDDKGAITLTVTDDGVGFPTDFDFMNTQSLGLQLVCMLVKQLQGEIELRNDNGSSVVVRFRGPVEG